MTRRYPLSALERARREAVDGGARSLAERARARAEAEARRGAAEQARAEEAGRARAVAEAERAVLVRGGLRVADLALGAAHAEGAALRDRAHGERVEQAVGVERAAERAEQGARGELVRARADARLVERHREGWTAAEQARAERSAEEDAAEVWGAARGRERA